MRNEEFRKSHQEACDKAKQNLLDTGVIGPWMDEPSRVSFKNQGYDCELTRTPFSYCWCGYVGVPKEHPAYGKDYSDDVLDKISVHGGLTYSAESEGLWWLGFDTAHCDDLSPGTDAEMMRIQGEPSVLSQGATYKDVHYAREETCSLAQQLKQMEDTCKV